MQQLPLPAEPSPQWQWDLRGQLREPDTHSRNSEGAGSRGQRRGNVRGARAGEECHKEEDLGFAENKRGTGSREWGSSSKALPKDPRGTQAHQWSCCCELQSWAHDWLGNFPSPSLHPDDITIIKHHQFLKQLLGASCQIRRSQAFTATATPLGIPQNRRFQFPWADAGPGHSRSHLSDAEAAGAQTTVGSTP